MDWTPIILIGGLGVGAVALYFSDFACPTWGAHCAQKEVSRGVSTASDVVSKAIDSVAATFKPAPRPNLTGPAAGDKTGQKQAGIAFAYPALSVA